MSASTRTCALAPLLATLLLCACPKKEWHYAPPPAPAPAKDFDAQFDSAHLDPNGAARDVDWRTHIPNPDSCNSGQPYTPACTQNAIFQDQPDLRHQAFCFIGKLTSPSPYQSFFGHADWMVAQYNGSIGWFNFGDDFDYDLFLIPGAARGITTNNNHLTTNNTSPQYIEMEFDSGETDSAFTKGWWNDFKTLGEANDDRDALAKLFHPSQPNALACGSAVGLFGLDCDHGCRSELHPVYGLAIQRTEKADDNEWSILARNWGTGGYCSQYNDQLAETNISIVLPYTSSQPPTKAEVADFASAANNSSATIGCPTLWFKDGQTVVNLTLPPPDQQAVAAFSLKLQWPAGAEPIACTQPPAAEHAIMALAAEHAATPARGESYMGALLQAAKQSQSPGAKPPNLEKDILPTLPKFQSRLKSMALAPPPQTCDGSIPITPGLPTPAPLQTVHSLKKDQRKQLRDDSIRAYICKNYRTKTFPLPSGTTPQDLDQACKGVK
jgi:hypothetical protein